MNKIYALLLMGLCNYCLLTAHDWQKEAMEQMHAMQQHADALWHKVTAQAEDFFDSAAKERKMSDLHGLRIEDTPESMTIFLTLPGHEKIDATVDGDTLAIVASGKDKKDEVTIGVKNALLQVTVGQKMEKKEGKVTQRYSNVSSMARSFQGKLNLEHVAIKYTDDILTLTIPKAVQPKGKPVAVQMN